MRPLHRVHLSLTCLMNINVGKTNDQDKKIIVYHPKRRQPTCETSEHPDCTPSDSRWPTTIMDKGMQLEIIFNPRFHRLHHSMHHHYTHNCYRTTIWPVNNINDEPTDINKHQNAGWDKSHILIQIETEMCKIKS